MRLKDRVAVITGGARGIGRTLAEGYAKEGARLVIADIEFAEAERTAKFIGGGAFAVALDVTKVASIEAMVTAVESKAGGCDILVNNAAIFDMAPFGEISEASFDRVFDVNVKGLVFTLQAIAGSMLRTGRATPEKRCKIINIASQAGRRGEALVAVYCASKTAVISFTQSAGLAYAARHINVNGIAPGVVDTPMWDVVDGLFAKYEGRPIGEKKRLVGEAVPFGRMGRPEDLVGCAVFLASPDSDYVVAQTYNVDGGNWLS